jgi:hypothetical protein
MLTNDIQQMDRYPFLTLATTTQGVIQKLAMTYGGQASSKPEQNIFTNSRISK